MVFEVTQFNLKITRHFIFFVQSKPIWNACNFVSISFANIKLVHKQSYRFEMNAEFIEGKHIINAKQMGEYI